MKRLLIGAGLCALLAAPAWAGEPAKLSLAQMDQVTAGNPCSFAFKSVATCIQANTTNQTAVAVSGGGFFSGAAAANFNETEQAQGDFNRL
jgi:hypothetical protein